MRSLRIDRTLPAGLHPAADQELRVRVETFGAPAPAARTRHSRFATEVLALTAEEVRPEELGKSALVFSPHPDDECLGCAGTILRKRQLGATVKIVYMTDGSRSHPPGLIPTQKLMSTRHRESLNAAAALGANGVFFLDFEDQRLSGSIRPAVERVTQILREEQPEEVFVPYIREPVRQAADHLAATTIVLAALAAETRTIVVWEYPVWFWLHWPWVGFKKGFLGRRFVAENSLRLLLGSFAFLELTQSVDISEVLNKKMAALAEHRSQMTELIPDSAWTTLGKISGGDFLQMFLLDHEFFRRSVVRKP